MSSQRGVRTRLGDGDGGDDGGVTLMPDIVPDLPRCGNRGGRGVDNCAAGSGNCHTGRMAADRFLTLPDVAEVLNISLSQTKALVRRGELEAIKIGGRGQWRVERDKLEAYISRMYDQTRDFLARNPAADMDDAGIDAD